jgi:hypothetical protein
MNDSQPPIVVVNIIAASYSGSTWANLLLGANPQAFSVGEIDNLQKFGKTLCTLHGEGCPVWSRFDVNSTENPFLQLHRITGKRFLIVNNSRRYLQAQRHPHIQSKFIFLIRDGRVVVASTRRKYPEISVWQASRSWAKTMNKKRRLIRRQPFADTFTVRYEDFQANLEHYARKTCASLGMTFEPGMLEYWNQEQHYVGGSIGTMNSVAKAQGIGSIHYYVKKQHFGTLLPPSEVLANTTEPAAQPLSNQYQLGDRLELTLDRNAAPIANHFKAALDHYSTTDLKNFVDERWKSELTDWQLRLFALAAGRLNRQFGYPRALDRH